mmetsp:Transcript_23751/g.68700  ORF Transcript_23751/g.68700 Transcript_23751/m.68700 type:complete len:221 (+) Transcript_23751:989-1651(+)
MIHRSRPATQSLGATMCSWPPKKKSTSSLNASTTGSMVKTLLCIKQSTSSAPASRNSRAAVRPTSASGAHSAASELKPASESQFSERARKPMRTPAWSKMRVRSQPGKGEPSGPVMFVSTHLDRAICPSKRTRSRTNSHMRSTPKSKSWLPKVPTCTPSSSMASIMCCPLVKALSKDGAKKSPPKHTNGCSTSKSRMRCQNRASLSLRAPPKGVAKSPRW